MVEVIFSVHPESSAPRNVSGQILSKEYSSLSDFELAKIDEMICLQHGEDEKEISLWKVKNVKRIIRKNKDVYIVSCFFHFEFK
ncbi:hypothetical protein [Proteus columbae]|uniref:hypothetical protein n=1 Tax=Proteus columbae TaxID=1987580 RepID=UPI0028895C1B|nr:hypothetical protein [Proteus columbae]